MSTSACRGSVDRVLVDLNTQCDLLLPGGAMPVCNRAEILPRIRQLMNWARLQQIPIISSLEAHRQGDSVNGLPPHCIDRTRGQRKLPFTLMPRRLFVQGDNTLDVPSDPFRRYQQVIFTKRRTDFLTNPKTDRLINAVAPHYWIVFGVTVSRCVKALVLGLIARQHRVMVVRDACGDWSQAAGENAFRQMDAKGGILVTTEQLTSGAVDGSVFPERVPDRDEAEEAIEAMVPDNGKYHGDDHRSRPAAKRHDRTHERQETKDRGQGKRPDDASNPVSPHLIGRKARSKRSSRASTKSRRGLA